MSSRVTSVFAPDLFVVRHSTGCTASSCSSALTHTTRSTKQLSELQEELDNLRPLLRLSIRSVDFRNTMLSMLKIAKEVIEEEDTQPERREQDLDQLMRQEEKFRVVRPPLVKIGLTLV